MDPVTFIGQTTLEMLKDGVAVKLYPGKSITDPNDGLSCSGWFDPGEKELVCATGQEDWLEVYAHEYCHYTQWKDGRMDLTEEDEIWDWLSGSDFPYAVVEKSVRASQSLEADNERRTAALIEKFDLPIDLGVYRQKCNAYILFYDVVLKTRRWADADKPVHGMPEVYTRLPSDRILDDSEFQNCPAWFLEAMLDRLAPPPQVKWWRRLLRFFKPVYNPSAHVKK